MSLNVKKIPKNEFLNWVKNHDKKLKKTRKPKKSTKKAVKR